MNQDFYYNSKEPVSYDEEPSFDKKPEAFKTGFAIASFVLSLVNICCCFCSLSFIFAPLSIIFGIIALAKKQGGKPFSIIGIVISVVSLIFFISSVVILWPFVPDINYFATNSDAIISEYEETGKVPEYFDKYHDPKYDKYWELFECKDFDEFFKFFVESYKSNETYQPDTDGNGGYSKSDDDGETLVALNYTGAISGMKFLTIK